MSLTGRKLGQYKITDMLDKGGMGTVYRAYQETVDRYVAIKVLPPHPGLDDEYIQRFQLEARTIGSLQHPHILPLYDYGAEEDVLYLVMAYVDGGTLDDLIHDGPMRLSRIEELVRQISGALDYAHRKGVVHRDIKPGNILIDAEGHALLADFGIVKMLKESSNLTGTGVVGTPAYMAPEQSQGMEIDGRVDIYALGVMVYEMLTGKKPFKADTPMQLLLKHINDPVPNVLDDNDNLPGGLRTVLETALAKDPDDRYQSAVEFAEAFSQAVHNQGDSLAAVQRAYPLDKSLDDLTEHGAGGMASTQRSGEEATETGANGQTIPSAAANAPENTTAPQTIIMRDSTNPLVLLAGFGFIALVIVVVAILLLNQQNSQPAVANNPTPDESTAVAVVDDTPVETVESAVDDGPIEPAIETFGQVRYTTIDAPGDAVNLRVEGLENPGDDGTYVAWLINTDSGEVLSLGELVVDAFGDGAQVFRSEDGMMLPASYNAVGITIEADAGDTPEGDLIYSGSVPVEVMTTLREIFVESEDGLNGGSLLEGASTEARTATQHAGLAARATSVGGMRSHAEHTLNILRGEEEDYDGDGRGANPGRGVGVYFFLDTIESLLDEAVNASDSTINVEVNAELIRVCTLNTRIRAEQVEDLENEMLEADSIESVEAQAAESTELTEALQSGVDLNENGNVEPFEGECGLNQIPEFGIQFGNIELVKGGLDADATE